MSKKTDDAIHDLARVVDSVIDGCRMVGPSYIGPLHQIGWNEAVAHVRKRVAQEFEPPRRAVTESATGDGR